MSSMKISRLVSEKKEQKSDNRKNKRIKFDRAALSFEDVFDIILFVFFSLLKGELRSTRSLTEVFSN